MRRIVDLIPEGDYCDGCPLLTTMDTPHNRYHCRAGNIYLLGVRWPIGKEVLVRPERTKTCKKESARTEYILDRYDSEEKNKTKGV